MTEITFCMEDHAITVVECKVAGARLAFTADGLKIYIDGKSDYHHPDCVNNLAMNACEERHIPLITLRAIKPVRDPKPFETNTKRMF